MAKYSRSNLINTVWLANQGVNKGQVEAIIKCFMATIEETVKAGNTVEIREFATFKPTPTNAKAARMGRNPQTGEPVAIEAKPAGKRVSIKAKFPAE